MTYVFFTFFIVMAWTAGMFDWMVSYATSVAQLGVWITLVSLVSGWTVWISLKRQPYLEHQKKHQHAHWSVNIKL
jgi:hypothetical protein